MTEYQQKELKKLKQDYNQTFGTEAGQRVLKDLKNRCFVYDSTYKGDGNGGWVNEGKRTVILTIESMMQLNVGEPQKESDENVNG